jgi:biotin/methionine sulfoxide reductase
MTHERVPHTSHWAPSWLPLVPGSDIALMLALAHTLVAEGRHDRAFSHATASGSSAAYLLGVSDGCPKTAEWAEGLSEIPAATIRGLGRRMATTRTLINVNYPLQRASVANTSPLGRRSPPVGSPSP